MSDKTNLTQIAQITTDNFISQIREKLYCKQSVKSVSDKTVLTQIAQITTDNFISQIIREKLYCKKSAKSLSDTDLTQIAQITQIISSHR